MPDFDVAIIGGGPGGSLAASLVLQQDPGRRVLVLERERFPRHHVGESTLASWQPILERAGVLPKLREAIPVRKLGGRFLWGRAEEQSWTLEFRNPDGSARDASYHVDRAAFDQLLLEHAASLGAEVHQQATVSAVARRDDGFEIRWRHGSGESTATTQYVIDASGQARLLARLWSLPVVPFDDMNNYAVWAYWKGSGIGHQDGPRADDERWTLISTCDDGWAWHIPTGPDCVSVGIVTEAGALRGEGASALEDFYLRNVRGCPEVGKQLEHAEIVQHPLARSRLLTIRDWSYSCERLCGDGWFLVGDAALFVDPILSTGLLITANAASMAANALHTLWNDPDVDAGMLLDSYDATYREAGTSFYRLARVWYSHNFQRSTWHWEAKRQRLRTGGDPWRESSAEAFFHLCIGSFADPVEGALPGVTAMPDVDRPDARIMAAHLFTPEERRGVRGDLPDATIAHPTSETSAHESVSVVSDRRWSELLPSRVRVRGCTWRRAESYFTDRTMNRWTRVSYVEVRPDGTTDPFDRVVFPSVAEMPDAVMPLLDGRTPLVEVLGAALQGSQGTERTQRLAALRAQILQLDYSGFLERVETAQPQPRPELPPPLAAALAAALSRAGERWRIEVDVLAQTLTLSLDGHSGVAVQLAAETPSQAAFLRTRTTRLWHPGTSASPPAERLLKDLAARLRAWEATEPEAAAAFWSRDFSMLSRKS